MSKILILNFGTSHDFIDSINLIAAQKAEYPRSQIEVMTFKKFEGLTPIINHVHKFHFVDEKMINQILENPLYSDAFAINQFTQDLEGCLGESWDKVINYANDNFSSYLISALESHELIGSRIDSNGIVRSSNQWSIYQNFVASQLNRQVLSKAFVRNHIAEIPLHSCYETIKIHPDYSMVAGQNFNRIRQMNGSATSIVIGLNLNNGHDGYQIDIDVYSDIIETLSDAQDFAVVLLLSGENYQRQMANELNKRFDNKLISINIDTIALPSVLSNIDTIVSSSNDQLAIANLMEVRTIELRDAEAKTKTPLSSFNGNYIIYQNEKSHMASDITLALNEEFGTQLPIDFLNTTNPTYKVVKDDYGVFQTQIRGDINIQEELRYHIERSFFLQLFGYPKNASLFEHIKENTEPEVLVSFVSHLRSELTSPVKILLATLRSLKGVKTSKSNLNSFIGYLDNLILTGKENTLVSSCIRLFEGKIENINTNDIDSNIKAIEDNLFELKANLQILTNIMSDLTDNEKQTQERVIQTE